MRLFSKFLCFITLAVFSIQSTTAGATTVYEETVKCPIGGKKFKHLAIGSYSTWGQRPDGKPYGSGPFPLPLTECPTNHLIMYRDFSPEELKQLSTLIVSDTYLNMIKHDTPYFRAAWLEKQLNPKSEIYLYILQRAIWETDNEAEKKIKYQDFLISEIEAQNISLASKDGVYWQYIKANALRERGRFDEALKLFDELPLDSLTNDLPSIAMSYDAYKMYLESNSLTEEQESRWYVLAGFQQLVAVIKRHDQTREPIDMIGFRAAAFKCKYEPAQLSDFERQYCLKPEVVEITNELIERD